MANNRKQRLAQLAEVQSQASAEEQPLVATYARVSSDKQAKEATIDRQVSVTRDRYKSLFGKNSGAVLIGEFKDEPYNLEAKDESKDFWILLDLVRKGRINTIITASSDRIFRGESAELRGEITDVFRKKNVRLITHSEETTYRTTDTSGRISSAVLQEMGAIAKLENSKTLLSGRIRKLVENDQWRLTNVPFGLRLKKTGDQTAPYEYTVHKEEAAYVRDIFRLYVGDKPHTLHNTFEKSSLSTYDIAQLLNEQHVSRSAWAANVPAAKDGPWNHKRVLLVLQNETYTGRLIVRFRRQPKYNISSTTKEVAVPRVIDDKLFERAALKYHTYNDKQSRNRRPRGHARWLHRIASCPTCHSPLIARRNVRTHPLYGCAKSDSHPRYRAEDLESMVAQKLEQLIPNDAAIVAIIKAIEQRLNSGSDKDAALKRWEATEKQLREKEELLDRLTVKWAQKGIDDETYERVRQKNLSEASQIKEQLASLSVALSALQHSKPRLDLSLENVRTSLKDALAASDADGTGKHMRRLLETLVDRVDLVPSPRPQLVGLSDEELHHLLKEGRILRKDVAVALAVSLTTIKRRFPGHFGMRAMGCRVDYEVNLRMLGDAFDQPVAISREDKT